MHIRSVAVQLAINITATAELLVMICLQ